MLVALKPWLLNTVQLQLTGMLLVVQVFLS